MGGGGHLVRIIFFGTPDYVIPILEKLHKYHKIMAVVTQPPKPEGRKKTLKYSAVDNWAHKHKVPIYFLLAKLPKADLGICASYGAIIPKSVIYNLKFGILNIHPSLLPMFRGSSPIQATLMAGSDPAISIIKMDEKIDHGPIVTQFKDELLESDTLDSVRIRLFERSAKVLLELIPAYVNGKITLKKQDEKLASFTKLVKKEDGFVDLAKDDPEKIIRKSKAYFPWPGIWTKLKNGKRLKILKCHLKDKKLILDEVQFEGKKPTTQFLIS